MKRYMMLSFAVAALTSHLAQAAPVDTERFVQSVTGSYRILLAGGEKPKEINSVAEVEAETDEAVFVMPYCLPDGLCDPGYLFFGYSDATVNEIQLTDGVRYEILVREAGQTKRYTWDEIGDRVRFTNYQYTIGNLGTLTHILKKEEEAF